MTEYLYHIGFDISIHVDSENDAEDLARQFLNMGETAIMDGVEVWSSDYEYRGEGRE